MQLTRRLETIQPRDCVVTIGSFDGLHLGHQALIERLLQHGAQRQLPCVMLSFEPLPREYLQPADPPARLTNFRERWRILGYSGLDTLCLLHFSKPLRSLSASQFMELLQAARARVVVVGHDFRFGRGGEANAQWCAERAPNYGFAFDVLAPVQSRGERVSSGRIRQAVAIGDFVTAQRLLGRPYSMRGRVRHGAQLGRTLGFPTANIAVKRRRVPLSGVFAVWVRGAGTIREPWPAVASLGTRPMAGGGPPVLEAFLFDFDGDLYDLELEVQFVALLRDEQTFESMDAMVVQMHRDAAEARRILGAEAGWLA
ncbi:MAG TPA: bifunctional riboflavin kinase/FAD synthetase [Steroidobacteraceae bacterium]|jgi:riboflavin kinase/FMN adenylyltransferase